MTALAPLLQAFFSDRLQKQRQVSPHTIAAYRDTFRLLLAFAQKTLGKQPSDLLLADLDATLIGSFLSSLEVERKNSPRTRNARLAAIRSFFRFASLQAPECLGIIQNVLGIPQKRTDRNIVDFLDRAEMEALLRAPDRTTWIGRRDYTLILLALQTGLRVSEIVNLRASDIHLATGPHVRCQGKGRKERCTPLTKQTVAALKQWLREQPQADGAPLFPSRRGGKMSRDAIEHLVAKYAAMAAAACPTLHRKNVTPHVLRHTAAVQLLQAGVDRSVIALWLGHESVETTQIYLNADLAIKERALAKTAPPNVPTHRYRPPDTLLAFLESL